MDQSNHDRRKLWRFFSYIACAALMITLMNVGAKLADKDVAPAELFKNPTAVQKTLGDNPGLQLIAHDWLLIDYVFIVAYVITALLVASSISLRSGRRRVAKYLAVLLVFGGAAFDVLEDRAQATVYESAGTVYSTHIQTFTAFKFALIFIGASLLLFLAAVKDESIGTQVARWVRALYFLRIPIFVTALMVGLPSNDASSAGFAEMSRGIFAVEGRRELFFAGLVAFSLSWSAMIVSRVILAYSSERFSLAPPQTQQEQGSGHLTSPPDEIQVTGNISWATIILWSVPAWFFISRVISVADYRAPGWEKWIIACLSAGAAFTILAVADLLRLHEKDRSHKSDHAFVLPTGSWLAKKASDSSPFLGDTSTLASLLRRLGPGYVETAHGRIHSGHIMATFVVSLLGLVYVWLGWASRPGLNSLSVAVAAYVAILLGLILWIGAATSFFLDRYRIPVLFAFVVLVSFLGSIVDEDHYYPVDSVRANDVTGLTPQKMLVSWGQRHDKDHIPLVIVTAAGGGIQAAGWTATVLSELSAEIPQFRDSIALISSVSGGSVGTMYFASTYVDGCKSADLVRLAEGSSLRQVAWGFAYPDAWHVFIGKLAGKIITPKDRAFAMEQAWRQYLPSDSKPAENWCGADHSLSTWRRLAANGLQPAVILNATIAETGQRLLITNFKAEDYSAGRRLAEVNLPSQQTAVAFDRNFPEGDLKVTTAARLSATFPVVTPVARPEGDHVKTAIFHAADGGYYDNYGIASAIEWLREAKVDTLLNNHRLLWIVIRAAPLNGDEDTSPASPAKARRWTWTDQALAPLTTLVNVRSASQWERDLLELELFRSQYNPTTIDPRRDCKVHPEGKVEIVSFEYRDDHPPLSWHLTSAQRRQLTCNYEGMRNVECTYHGWQDCSINKVKDAFNFQ